MCGHKDIDSTMGYKGAIYPAETIRAAGRSSPAEERPAARSRAGAGTSDSRLDVGHGNEGWGRI
jgi:hypothetical protein